MYPRVKVREDEIPATIRKEEVSFAVRAVESLSIGRQSTRILVLTHGSRSENDTHPPHARISKSRPKSPLTPTIDASKGKKNYRSSEDDKTKGNGFGKDTRCQNDSHSPHARISQSYPKISLMPSIVASKEVHDLKLKNNDENDEDDIHNTRASLKVKNNDGSDDDNNTYIRASSIPPPRAVLSSPDNDGIIGNQNQQIREKQTPLRRQAMKSDGASVKQNQMIREKKVVAKPKSEVQGKQSCQVDSPQSAGRVSNEAANDSKVGKGKHVSEPPVQKQRPPFILG